MNGETADWERERRALLERRISELGLDIRGSPLEPLVARLYDELAAKGLVFRPRVYLSDEWGCPSDVPLIGVPFYLADRRLARLEEERSDHIEGEAEAMKYLRHEAGHAFNYAYRLYDRGDWREMFGPYSRPYRERYRADPFSRDHVRHILGWYAQKHPDEDFAESFAVWLTPEIDWRAEYAYWPALRKLEYVERVMREVGGAAPDPPVLAEEHLPVDAMHYTVEEHYREAERSIPLTDERHFDGDLRTIFRGDADAGSAAAFLRAHRGELVRRMAYWSGEPPGIVRAFLEFLAQRAEALELRAGGREASTLIELTAFGTAVLVNYRYTDVLGARPETQP
ncbi:MAG TPA: hypothetical protein VK939_14485 [Longimicrobiales bacterium]|nr:hypothetical protein [Longimicrobiales bacterium]